MRTLQFRVFDSSTKLMIDLPHLSVEFGTLEKNYDCETIMQFTGLQDKNGKDIYEGDIIKSIHSDSDRSGRFFLEQKLPLSLNGVMTYNDRQAQFEIVMEKNSLNIVSTSIGWCHEDFEVIGNIFENPELLLKTPDLTSKETIDTIGNCPNCGVEFHIHKEVFEKDELLSNLIKDCIEKVNTEVPFGKEDAYDMIVDYIKKIQ